MVSKSENSKNCVKKIIQRNTDDIKSEKFVNLGTKYKNIDLSKYEINEFGQIKNVKTKTLLKIEKLKMYDRIQLFAKNNNRYNIFIHQSVATIFLENPNNYPIVHHKDEKRDNNHVSNLEWTTQKQNITYSRGKKIGQYSLKDEFIKEYDSASSIYDELNKTYCSHIRNVCNGKNNSAYGFKWKWI
jgi:hypothetical protein